MSTETAAPEALHAGSRLGFPALSIVAEGDEYLVGDPDTRTFISIPEAGVAVLRELQARHSIAEATAILTERFGQEVDVLDFATTLLAVGLVSEIDGVQVGDVREARREPAGESSPVFAWVAPFYSRPAWIVYGALFVFSVGVFIVRPAYFPTFEDFFYYPDPFVSIVTFNLASIALSALHELSHWLATRLTGARASIRLSQRLYFVVLEADLSELLAVPRKQRYGPLLAGMAFDTVVLAGSLALHLTAAAGLLPMPAVIVRFLAAITLLQVAALVFQFLVFIRTDVYAVMVTALGCRNLSRIARLRLKRVVMRLSPDEQTEWETAHPRDLMVARWFGLVYVAGLALIGWFFVTFFFPSTLGIGGWLLASLATMRVTTLQFWESLVIAIIAVANIAVPIATASRQWWQRRQSR